MFKTSFQIAKIFGIPIRVDLSLLVLMGLIWYDTFNAGLSFLAANLGSLEQVWVLFP